MARPIAENDKMFEDVVATVEQTMKKYADNLLKVLEGMSSRLTQLESISQRLERSVNEMRLDSANNHNEEDDRFRMLENHVREVHRAVQILRDKQEIVDAQTELVKLQLAKKESSSNLAASEDRSRTTSSISDGKQEQTLQSQNHQLLPALPAPPSPQQMPTGNLSHTSDQSQSPQHHQSPSHGKLLHQTSDMSMAPQQVAPVQQQPNPMTVPSYYQQPPPPQQGHIQPSHPHATQMPSSIPPPQIQQPSYMSQQGHIHSVPNQGGQLPVPQSPAHIQQQCQMPPQLPPQQLQQSSHLSPNVYQGQPLGVSSGSYSYVSETPNQQSQLPYNRHSSGLPVDYNYGNQASQPPSQGQLAIQGPRPQHNQGGPLPSDQTSAPPVHPMHGYSPYIMPPKPQPGPYGPPPPPNAQMNSFPGPYTRYPSQSQQYMNSASSGPSNPSGANSASGRRNDDIVEQVAAMGFPREEARAVIQRLAESGQPVDLNVVIDRLNSGAPGPSQRGWYN